MCSDTLLFFLPSTSCARPRASGMPAAVAAAVASRCALDTVAPFLSALAGAASATSTAAPRVSIRLMHLGTLPGVRGWRLELVEPPQDHDGLGTQGAIQR